MSGETISLNLSVDRVTETKQDDRSITVILKGKTMVVNDLNGWDVEDTVEATLTLKFGMMYTAEKLGVDEYMDKKVLVLKNRDNALFADVKGIEKLEV